MILLAWKILNIARIVCRSFVVQFKQQPGSLKNAASLIVLHQEPFEFIQLAGSVYIRLAVAHAFFSF